jgi:hypothetical protein
MGLTWDGQAFWAVSHEDSMIYQLNATTGSIIKSFPSPNPYTVETGCEGMAWDGQYIWYADSNLNRIYQLSPTDGTEVASFASPGSSPQGLAWDGTYLWHFDRSTSKVYQLDSTDGSIRKSFHCPGVGEGDLAWDGSYLWLSRNSADRIYKIDVGSQPPVAEAGEAQTVYEGDVVQFDGSASYDPDGTITSYLWDFDANVDSDGDSNPTNDIDATGPNPTHIYGDDGIFIATLRVIDNENLSAEDICNITVLNVDPQVNIESATMDIEIGLRVAGRKFNDVGMTIYEGGNSIGYVSIERLPGSPDHQMAWIPISIDFSKSYTAVVTFIPEDPPNIGANPVWIYLKSQNGSIKKIHHTFNVQQSKIRDSDHWNHVDPWEVDLNTHLVGLEFQVDYHITDPGSDDEILTYTYGIQIKDVEYLNNPPNPDPYPSPDVNPRDIVDTITMIYEGPGAINLIVRDDDNIRLGIGGGSDFIDVG